MGQSVPDRRKPIPAAVGGDVASPGDRRCRGPTDTGIQAITKLNDQYHLMLGIHGGNDMAPWTTSSQPNAEILLKWVSKDNKDSLFGGIDSIGRGKYKVGHDDLQVLALTWSHKFDDKLQTMTEG